MDNNLSQSGIVTKYSNGSISECDLLRWKQLALNIDTSSIRLEPSRKSLYWAIKDKSCFIPKFTIPIEYPRLPKKCIYSDVNREEIITPDKFNENLYDTLDNTTYNNNLYDILYEHTTDTVIEYDSSSSDDWLQQ